MKGDLTEECPECTTDALTEWDIPEVVAKVVALSAEDSDPHIKPLLTTTNSLKKVWMAGKIQTINFVSLRVKKQYSII